MLKVAIFIPRTVFIFKVPRIRRDWLLLLALLRGHHVDPAGHKGHLLATAFWVFRFRRFVLGNGLGAFKLLPAFLATILVGWHGLESDEDDGVYRSLWPAADM